MNFEVSLAEILGIENEYDLLNKQAKVCTLVHIYITQTNSDVVITSINTL